MKKIEIHARVIDRLLEHLEKGNKEVNLLEELTGELSFEEIRAAVHYLETMGYITYNKSIPQNQGFLCKITKEGIKYHQEIFEQKQKKSSWIEKLKSFFEMAETAKTAAFSLFMIITLVFGINIKKIASHSPFIANILGIEIDEKAPQKNIPSLPDRPVKKTPNRQR